MLMPHVQKSLTLSPSFLCFSQIENALGKRPINHQKHHHLQNQNHYALTFWFYWHVVISLFDQVFYRRKTTAPSTNQLGGGTLNFSFSLSVFPITETTAHEVLSQSLDPSLITFK